jgi:hypothetical protein
VSHSFTIARSRRSVLSDAALLEEIRRHTETDGEASSILRSLERFGGDGSIRYFEITPKQSRRTYGDRHHLVAWSVTAVR